MLSPHCQVEAFRWAQAQIPGEAVCSIYLLAGRNIAVGGTNGAELRWHPAALSIARSMPEEWAKRRALLAAPMLGAPARDSFAVRLIARDFDRG